MPKKRKSAEYQGYKCHKKGLGIIVLGLLILANAYWGFLGWDYFTGALLVLAGIIKMIMHMKYM